LLALMKRKPLCIGRLLSYGGSLRNRFRRLASQALLRRIISHFLAPALWARELMLSLLLIALMMAIPDKKGGIARVVTYKTEYAQTLIDDSSIKEKAPHIAISVDMLDTGLTCRKWSIWCSSRSFAPRPSSGKWSDEDAVVQKPLRLSTC
jgi:hypothetical protein